MTTTSTFRIPKATSTGLYGRALAECPRRTWGQVPDNAYVLRHDRKVVPNLDRLHAVPSVP
jgi:hypothetical protein